MKNKNISIKLIAILLTFTFFTSCNDDDPQVDNPEDKKPTKLALITTVKNPDGHTFSTYLQKIEDINSSKTIDNTQAHEMDTQFAGGVYEFNKSVFVNNYMTGGISKFNYNNNEVLQASLGNSGLSFQGNIAFKDENTAYVGATGKILIFNPNSMLKTGAIDLSSKSRVGEVTDFPETGSKITVEGVTEIVISGNYMYAAMYYMNDMNTFTPGTANCSIVVIDMTKIDVNSQDNSSAIVDLITDERGSFTGAWNTGGGVYYMKKIENGDIYMLCHNLWGGKRSLINKPACILRIKSGEKTFDSNYYFDLETASQGNNNPVTNFEYYGNGKFLATVLNPAKLDASNPYSFSTDPVFKWWDFDLTNKTAKKLNDEYTNSGKVARCYFEDGNAYIPYSNKSGDYISKVNLKTYEATKTISTTGMCHILKIDK